MGGQRFNAIWGLSTGQKKGLVKRLRAVDSVISTLAASGVKLIALVTFKVIYTNSLGES